MCTAGQRAASCASGSAVFGIEGSGEKNSQWTSDVVLSTGITPSGVTKQQPPSIAVGVLRLANTTHMQPSSADGYTQNSTASGTAARTAPMAASAFCASAMPDNVSIAASAINKMRLMNDIRSPRHVRRMFAARCLQSPGLPPP